MLPTVIGTIVALAVPLYALFVVVLLIYEERDPSTTLAWALLLIVFPGIGLVFYLIFGRNWRVIGRRDQVRAEAVRMGQEMLAPIYDRWADGAAAALAAQPTLATRIATAVEAQNGTRMLPCTRLEIFSAGEDKFARLYDDIAAATESVHLEYFIWEHDELTARFCALLAEKARAGVEVRVLYDWIGSLPYRKAQLRELKRSGAQVHADVMHLSRLNYRNHIKMAVMDGRIAYTGGMNMGQEYIDGKPRYESWRDTHIRFEGPLVADLQRLFCGIWYRVTREALFSERYFPELGIDGGGRVVWSQMAYSGPESRWPAIRNAYLLAILAAERTVRIQSPYFVPDEAIAEALASQSLAGTDVRFMMTGVPDKKIAWNAAFSYIDELVLAGGRMFHYTEGFFHPKTMTIDGSLAVIGTTNFDYRSFVLHDEISLFFYDERVAEEQDRLFAADEARCTEILAEHYEEFGRLRRLNNGIARLTSRLL